MQHLTESKFLRNTGLTFIAAVFAIALCYVFFDRPIAFKMHAYHLPKFFFFKWMNSLALITHLTAFFLIIALGIKAALRRLTHCETCFFIFGITGAAATYLKDFCKAIFGRFWPDTWYMNNPSLIKNQAYGFHFWHWDHAYGAFPSGHTTIVFCAMTFVWFLAPRWRWLALVACIFQMIPLIAFNYHFLGDIVAGAFLGFFCTLFAIRQLRHAVHLMPPIP